jgi:hypothetical protein
MNEWVIGGMILTRETVVLGEKKKHYTASVVDEW